jgi:hypothetical protein
MTLNIYREFIGSRKKRNKGPFLGLQLINFLKYNTYMEGNIKNLRNYIDLENALITLTSFKIL